jgi:hypothetical protein
MIKKAAKIRISFFLRLQPICNCLGLIFLKITRICLAREWTAVSGRFIWMPITLELSPVSANLRSLSSSACVHGRERSAAVLKADARGGAAHFILESNT